MRRLLPFLALLGLVIAASVGGMARSNAATAEPLAESALTGITSVDGGLYFTCARTAQAQVRCWGQNNKGQLGDGTHTDRKLPVTVLGTDGVTPLSGVRQVDVGASHACALLTSGAVVCWGFNSYGQVGEGGATDQVHAAAVHGVGDTGTLQGIAQIAVGGYSSCARTTTGQVRCWGQNTMGQLGNGETSTYQPFPVVVENQAGTGPLTGATQLATGDQTGCIRTTGGEARCWGRNVFGALGDGTTTDRLRPVPVRAVSGPGHLTGVAQLALANLSSCARLTSGQVRCWGYTTFGAVGTGTTSPDIVRRPRVVVNTTGTGPLRGARQLVMGHEHACAVVTGGQVRCWGNNGHGYLGNGATVMSSRPVIVRSTTGTGRLSGVTRLGAGYSHTCARLTSGELACWGQNDHGALGDGTVFEKHTPTPVVAA